MSPVNFLRIPLTLIFRVDDIEGFQGLNEQQLEALQLDYDPDEIANIVAALRFAEANPQFDFASLLPGVTKSNAQIHRFLVKILRSIEAGGPGTPGGT
ncbi:MAG TPA: hypothetical protein VFP68_25240 [Burkholderiaceae bacterium]|nr:hypothetical protein [Burkholderiaceae bacterium]